MNKIGISILQIEKITQLILAIRGQKVILDSDLALLYEVTVGHLNESVKRNIKRFPSDFMFQLTDDELENLKSQIAISKKGRGGRRTLPFAFTEYGVAMLSSVLNSERAITVNIEIMRAFGKLRHLLSSHADLVRYIKELEKKYNANFDYIFRKLEAFENPPIDPDKLPIGFNT
jgi:hypothetical protein